MTTKILKRTISGNITHISTNMGCTFAH